MTCASMLWARSHHASQKPSRPASKATAMRVIFCPAFSASSRHRWGRFSNPSSPGASFFNGWRSTPGMIPATSQVFWLSSTTAIKVRLRSSGVSERFRSFSALCRFGLRIGGSIGVCFRQRRWMPPNVLIGPPTGDMPRRPHRILFAPAASNERKAALRLHPRLVPTRCPLAWFKQV